jgi:hypothetical protein
MSTTEIIVIAFGLFIGYWLVSKLMAGKPDQPAEKPEAGKPDAEKRDP